jgi:DivIVA domain-containing protein
MTLVYVLLGALVVGAVAFGVAVLVTGADPGLAPAEPDGSAVPLPGNRPLAEPDFQAVRFDTGLRGYRMTQVDSALRRAAYDVGYKEELVAVLEAEVAALRGGRQGEADALREARLAALADRESDAGAGGSGMQSLFGAEEPPADAHPLDADAGPADVEAAPVDPAKPADRDGPADEAASSPVGDRT